ncbi:NAD(P)H-dependent glycerol-3-phosphate dehydrogenase [Vagococcus luciliae]|uniref:Glycerol-3-phosphate dehydrogenase [NAD(P)+] n=1 Tax=Vagococcus luciliae TaxID=2920380 RepID=A0ABY5P006_9ENTE|nr:NAD(P)H-dependent glycerol-3-phosphate dehydrogenase [Vagococcus luciliae]UUV99112.1 Glycerol-3-phosphate dehydrogenase [NAD(P)+] [Vagococcus luciliae]
MKQKIAVLGAGSWGTALAMVLVENGHDVIIWGHKETQINEINTHHTNAHYLKEITLPSKLKGTSDLKECVKDADAVLFVVPTKAMRDVSNQFNQVCDNQPVIIHASKGLEQDSHKRITEILEEEISPNHRQAIVVLSGPSHAEEVAVKDVTTITAASNSMQAAEYVQRLFSNDYFRVYTNSDVIGVEMGAALKNIIALGSGALHGLGYGDNARAAIMTRGLAEISRLGVAMGANPLTFIGLSGVGDLAVTCASEHSRNFRAGYLLGKGNSLDDVLNNMGMIVEGVYTTKAAYQLAQERHIEMPITEAIYDVIYNHTDVPTTVKNIMLREHKSEQEL